MATTSKKQYEQAAKMIARLARYNEADGKGATVFALAFFKADNPAFKPDFFLARIEQWEQFIDRRFNLGEPVGDGEYEATSISEMRKVTR